MITTILTIRKNNKCSDSKFIQEYLINNTTSNINEGFVLDTLRILVTQNKPTFFGHLCYIVKSNWSDKCNIPIDCDALLKVMHRDVQEENSKITNIIYPEKMTGV